MTSWYPKLEGFERLPRKLKKRTKTERMLRAISAATKEIYARAFVDMVSPSNALLQRLRRR